MIRYGILGFGHHGVKRLAPGFQRARRSQLIALSRSSKDKAEESARQFNVPYAFDSKAALCSSPVVDAIIVATPNALHCEDVLLALRHGKPVLCEKPMALNAAQAQEMTRAAQEAGLLLGVAQVFRFEASTNRLRARIAAGEIGTPVLARAEFSFDGRDHSRSWLLDRQIAGGGPLADVGIHCIDALRYILNDEVTSVAATGNQDAQSGTVESAAIATLRFTRGTLGTVLTSFRSAYRTPLEIVGDAGTFRVDNGLMIHDQLRIELWRDGACAGVEEVDNTGAYGAQVDAFAAALEEGVPFPAPAEDGVRNQRILDAAYSSMTSGVRVEL